MSDYFPHNRDGYLAWLRNFQTQLGEIGPGIGLTEPQIEEVRQRCQGQLDAFTAMVEATSAAKAARRTHDSGRAALDKFLRRKIKHWKTLNDFTPASAAALRVVSPRRARGGAADDQAKPHFTLSIVADHIQIAWVKDGFDAVNVYCRLNGESKWVHIGMDTVSPFLDRRPPSHPSGMEVREYMLRYVRKDKVVGQDSDIQSIAFAPRTVAA